MIAAVALDLGSLRIPLTGGGTLAATVSDQAAGLFAAIHSKDDAVAINLGTGGFIMAPLGHEPMNVKGYLTAPIQRTIAGKATYCLEGTINAIGPALDAHPGPSPMPDEIDPNPDLFCLADNAGVGAPYWQADPTLTFSRSIIHLCDGDVRRSIMEGIIFRVCQIVQDFLIIQPLTRLIVSGGMAKELFIVQGLSAVTGLKTAVSLEPEATLWGASSLAADKPVPPPAMEIVPPSFKQWSYLKSKFQRWKQWMGRILPDIRQY